MRKLGIILAVVVFVTDRLSKWLIVDVVQLEGRDAIQILPFFDLTMVWNRGISLGMFQAGSDGGRYVIIGVTSALVIGLVKWLWSVDDKLNAVALGAITGGAIGNIWDRFEYKAVADFMHFSAFEHSFYVFNVADAAISVGVVILLWDALLSPRNSNK